MKYKQYAMNHIYGLVVRKIGDFDYGSMVGLEVVGYTEDAMQTAKEVPIGYIMDISAHRFKSDYVPFAG